MCGGLTTFSGLAVDLARRLDAGDVGEAAAMGVLSLGLGLSHSLRAGGVGVIAVLFVVTAAAGTLLRWQASMSVPIRAIATFAVNIGGAFALGLLSTASADSQLIGGVAGTGALTTFSTFVAELFEIHQIDRGWAWRYGAATFVFGVAAAWIGLTLA